MYQKAKIYEIIDNTNGNVYIGSTTKSLKVRLTKHENSCKAWNDGKRRKIMSFDIINNGDYEIKLIEDFPCNSKKELEEREKFFIESRVCINRNIPHRTRKETYDADNEKRKEAKKQWYQQNKARILAERKEKYNINK